MKIVHAICTYPPYKGGMGNTAQGFHAQSLAAGLDSRVFTPRYSREIELFPKAVYLRPLLHLGNGAVLPQLLWRLRPFDIVHLHYPFFGSAEILALYALIRPSRQKLILHYHMDVHFNSFWTRILAWPEKLALPILLRQADRVIVSSLDYALHSRLQKYYHRIKNKLTELPFGVDTRLFYPPAKKSFGPRLLFVSALDKAHYFKGLKLLLRALAEFHDPGIRLDIVGRGDLSAEYQAYARKLGIGQQAVFHGFLNDHELQKAYRQADIFVLPSVNGCEAFGLVLLEAMATGLAVIASRLPGVQTVFDDQVQGLYVQPGSLSDLTAKIKTLAADQALCQSMGRQSRVLAESKYGWKGIADRLHDIYNSL